MGPGAASRMLVGICLLLAGLGASGAAGEQSGMTRHSLLHEGVEREWFVFRPKGIPAGQRLAVVVGLHGYGSTATGFEAAYQLNRHAQDRGYMAVYPQGSHFVGSLGEDPAAEPFLITSWNDLASNFTPGPQGELHCTAERLKYPCPPECGECNRCAWTACRDDVGFLLRVIDDVQARHATDTGRLYLLGNSNGGSMAMRLACRAPERFAAVAVNIIQMPPGFACAPGLSLPLLHLYGALDDTVGHDGTPTSDGWIFTSVAETMRVWAEGLGCARDPSAWNNDLALGKGLECRAWDGCRMPGHQAVTCMDPLAGHEWRGQRLPEIPASCVAKVQVASLPGQPSCPAPADDQPRQWGMELVWRFFSEYRRELDGD